MPNAARKRKNVTFQGVSMPVGIWPLKWASGEVAAQIFLIISEEVLGYNTVAKGGASSSASGVRAVAGCIEASSSSATHCRKNESLYADIFEYHVALETWGTKSREEAEFFERTMIARAPTLHADMGYEGADGPFIKDGTLTAAINDVGQGLDFYRSYNGSWHDPAQFFTRLRGVNTSTAWG